MKMIAAVVVAGVLLVPVSNAHSQGAGHSFSVQAADISGDPTGAVLFSGGGHFDPLSGALRGGGHFRCTRDIDQGPLTGCKAGEGVRWEAVSILPSTGFSCTGSPAEPVKTVVTDGNTIAMQVNFFREGDGAIKSFTARVFISADDEDSDRPGIQNVWIAGVGCGEARVNIR